MWEKSTFTTQPKLKPSQVLGNVMQKLSKLQHPLYNAVCATFQSLSFVPICGPSWWQWNSRHGIDVRHSSGCVSIHV